LGTSKNTKDWDFFVYAVQEITRSILTFNMMNPMPNPILKPHHVLVLLAILNVVVIAVMQSFGESLLPYTIVAFEFASTPERAHQMVNVWQQNGVLDAVYFLIGFDYLFMLTYSTFLWLACMQLAKYTQGKITVALAGVAWMQPLAAILDAIENLALFQIIEGSHKTHWPLLAAWCAGPKFAMAGVGLLAIAIGGIRVWLRK
jgi:hypothetical protein